MTKNSRIRTRNPKIKSTYKFIRKKNVKKIWWLSTIFVSLRIGKEVNAKTDIMKVTKEQLLKLTLLRTNLIELFNTNESGISFSMISDLDETIEEIIKK